VTGLDPILPDMQTGHITTGPRPDWEPLVALVGRDVVGCFAWKFALGLDDGVAVHAYRNIATDGYLLLAADGRAFVHREGERYEELAPAVAVDAAFAGWEEARRRARNPDAIRALLERHRTPATDAAA
jgi:hypothetical protein